MNTLYSNCNTDKELVFMLFVFSYDIILIRIPEQNLPHAMFMDDKPVSLIRTFLKEIKFLLSMKTTGK